MTMSQVIIFRKTKFLFERERLSYTFDFSLHLGQQPFHFLSSNGCLEFFWFNFLLPYFIWMMYFHFSMLMDN